MKNKRLAKMEYLCTIYKSVLNLFKRQVRLQRCEGPQWEEVEKKLMSPPLYPDS